MKTYKIYTLGCKVNQYDSGKLASELAQANFIAVDKNANIAIINSCAVTKTAIIKSGRMIKLAKRKNPKAKIILTGCWPRVSKVNFSGVDYAIRGDKVIKQINKITNYELKIKNEIASPAVAGLAMTARGRYFIKIQDGCEQFCSYCIIPYTRGKLKSRGEPEIICEIKQAVKAGYREIVLSGIHLGLYGKTNQLSLRGALATRQSPVGRKKPEIAKFIPSVSEGPALSSIARNDSLAGLLKKVIKINQLGRVRLSSIEITEVSEELVALMAESEKICKHLHIPLQAGSDKILKLMNRPYDLKYFENKIKKIRRVMPDIAISTDVIAGFPGETEKDSSDTLNFIKHIKFSRLHVFPFSAHEKTPAFKFSAQVEEKIKARRAKILRQLGIRLEDGYKKKFKGRELEVAVEQIKQDKIIGKTEYYFDIKIDKKILKNKKPKNGEIISAKY